MVEMAGICPPRTGCILLLPGSVIPEHLHIGRALPPAFGAFSSDAAGTQRPFDQEKKLGLTRSRGAGDRDRTYEEEKEESLQSAYFCADADLQLTPAYMPLPNCPAAPIFQLSPLEDRRAVDCCG